MGFDADSPICSWAQSIPPPREAKGMGARGARIRGVVAGSPARTRTPDERLQRIRPKPSEESPSSVGPSTGNMRGDTVFGSARRQRDKARRATSLFDVADGDAVHDEEFDKLFLRQSLAFA